jgi:hypothetical protein
MGCSWLGATTLLPAESFSRCGYKLPLVFSESYKVSTPKNDDKVDKDPHDISRKPSELRPTDMKHTDNKMICSA